jgi:AraC family transcriptional activator of tynA and feaB
MQMLPAHAALLSGDAETHVANQVLDLVAMALGERAEVGQVKLGSASALTLIRLRSAVEQALPSRDLTCQDVAAVAGISLRYANTLLAKEGTSHFSKAFKSAFGVSPRDYRRGASGAQSPAE